MDHDLRKRVFTPQAQKVIWLSGLALALHFGTWVPSLDKTSLTHSLLFVTAHPLVIVVGMVFLAKIMTNQRSPTTFEVIGAVLGVLGAAITLLDQGDVQGSHTVTAFGDFLAFLGAIFVVGYIVCGKILTILDANFHLCISSDFDILNITDSSIVYSRIKCQSV